MKKIKIHVTFAIIALSVASCATTRNEHTQYLEIKSQLANERYSKATFEIMKFENDYPQSQYLCELWNVQIAYFKDLKSSAEFVKKTEDKYNEKCLKR